VNAFKLLFEADGSRSSCPRLLNCRWKKNAQFFQRRRGLPHQLMVPLRCNRYYRPGHVASKCIELSKVSPSIVNSFLSCFNCGREGYIARNCRKSTRKVGIGRDTENEFGSVGRDAALQDGVDRDAIKVSGTQSKGWIRSRNDRRELSSNPTTARRLK
jgi:hypothetical protein